MTRLPSLWVPLDHLRGSHLAPHALVRARDDRGSLAAGSQCSSVRRNNCDCRAMRLAQGPETLVLSFLIAATAIVATKPHGRPLWLGLMVVAVAMAGNPLKWEKKSLAVVAFAVLVILTSGSGQQGSWLFLNSALPFVQTQGEPYSEYRAILRPLVEKARANLPNYATQQSRYKKVLNGSRPDLGDEWPALAKNKDLYKKVATRLALEGIISHPLEYAHLVLRKIAAAADNMTSGKVSPAGILGGAGAEQCRAHEARKRARTRVRNADRRLPALGRSAPHRDDVANLCARETFRRAQLDQISARRNG